ncbi:unnamed protein product [Blepharisma stoltei]|uniref:arginine--tRNA ligase n=1 Tax=Blepharisma stoltei TaxID=1481888 RepID=A0AAU9JPC1_9CILI|nr:unnamed protein product [Blepharisma stoltei]
MQSIIGVIKHNLLQAIQAAVPVTEPIIVTPAAAKFKTDFISPIALAIFNKHKKEGCFGFKNPQELAQAISSHITQNEVIQSIEVAGNGFLNIHIQPEYLASLIHSISASGKLQVNLNVERQKVLVDFSSPNIAKEMHVGHLRSTIIGDAICRCLEFLGHEVLRTNHLGDWGTQFGMLLTYLNDTYPDWETNAPDISDLETFYKAAKGRFDQEPEFKERSRLKVVDLQGGEENAIKAWKYIYKVSRDYLQIIYDRLDIKIEDCGESFYNPMLPGITQELVEKGFAVQSEGALCFHVPGFELPLMVQKSDGGYGYDSTDLAAAKYRLLDLGVKRAIYVTDMGQNPHFLTIFEAAKLIGWHRPPETRMDHAGFGVVLGEDGKKFKTRSGESVKLITLLDEAHSRAKEQLLKRSNEPEIGQQTHLNPSDFENAAEAIGVSAIKYYDLKQNRISTYEFSFDRMLDPRGNTAVYLIYAYARICSILDKAGQEAVSAALGSPCILTASQERALALWICRFPDTLETVIEELSLNKLCDLIYEVTTKFSEFYSNCKVIGSPEQASRLQLCLATKFMLLESFTLLGIKPLERI